MCGSVVLCVKNEIKLEMRQYSMANDKLSSIEKKIAVKKHGRDALGPTQQQQQKMPQKIRNNNGNNG